MQRLVSRAKFSELAGVNPSTITRISKTVLAAALVGRQVDAEHPDAVAYLEKQITNAAPPPATGIDPMYDKALQACRDNGRYTAGNIQRSCRIGFDRSKNLIAMLKAAGLVPTPAAKHLVEVENEATKHRHIPHQKARKPVGAAAVKESKKNDPYYSAPIEVPANIEAFADMTLREVITKFGTDVRFVDWLKATQAIESVHEKRLKNAQTEGLLVSRQVVKIGIIDPIDSAHIKLLSDGSKTIARRAFAMAQAGKEVKDVEVFVADQISSFIKPMKAKIDRALRNV